MTPPVQRPDRTHRAADRLLIVLAAVAAAAVCVFLWTPTNSAEKIARVPVFFGSWLAGFLLPRLHPFRFRALGLAPYAATAGVIFLAAVGGPPDTRPAWQVGAFCLLEGLAVGAVLRFRDRFRAEMGHLTASAAAGVAVAASLLWAYSTYALPDEEARAAFRWVLLGLAVAAALLAWATLLRNAIEFGAEFLTLPVYRITTAGPGLAAFPRAGPVVVIANHAAYFDPLFLAKWVPRPVTPMMTATFYDLPVLRLLMRYVFHVIRVNEIAIRRDAQEVQEAIAALDAGKCVVIFPEGYLRRKEDVTLRRFGQGVWQILKARPDTPVVACWIDGNWGSYFSFKDGPPMKNKKFDLRRPIRVGVSAPETVPPEVLAEHLPTRVYLMNKVLDARAHLGLPAVPRVELPAQQDDEEKGEE
jgi:1-acyl-sn-glycerol-3-phosphate acyltransferase